MRTGAPKGKRYSFPKSTRHGQRRIDGKEDCKKRTARPGHITQMQGMECIVIQRIVAEKEQPCDSHLRRRKRVFNFDHVSARSKPECAGSALLTPIRGTKFR